MEKIETFLCQKAISSEEVIFTQITRHIFIWGAANAPGF